MYMSNYSLEEAIEYGTKEQVVAALVEEETPDPKEVEKLERNLEIISEQLFFANNLIDELEAALVSSTKLSEFRNQFKTLLSNSMFERS